MPTAHKEKKTGTFTGRARIRGVLDESKGGFRTKTEAREWARTRENAWRDRHRPRGKGPGRTTLAEGLSLFAKEQLSLQKGAKAKVDRINIYLRLAGRPTLKAVRCAVMQHAADASGAAAPVQKYFDIVEIPATQERRVVPSLKACRDRLERSSEASTAIRKRLAGMWVADISLADLDELVKARRAEGKGASTQRHDVDVIRSFINEVRKIWNWRELRPIAPGDVTFSALPPGRDRTMDYDEEEEIAKALQTSYHPKALPAVAFLTESAMRFAEAMDTICWIDVLWDKQRLKLRDAKAGAREVPLSKGAMKVLSAMERGAPHEPIFGISYESLKAIFRRACERAGIRDLRLHDLRHTAATRTAKRLNGNIFLLKLVTGHKTLSQLERYVNLKADDAVEALNATEPQARQAPSVELVTAPQRGDEQREPRRIAQPRYKGGKQPAGAVVIALPTAVAAKVPASSQQVIQWGGLSVPGSLAHWGSPPARTRWRK